MSTSSKPVVIIVGAGVIGLSTALTLQTHLSKTHTIIIVARDFPPEESINYASMWAGAHVRPIPGNTPQLLREGKWLAHTYDVFERIAEEEPWAGVRKVEGVEYFAKPLPDYVAVAQGRDQGLYASTPGFRQLGREELPRDVVLGFRYDTYCVNSPVYCMSLLRKFRMRGGKILRRSLVSEREGFTLAENVMCVVNASGMGFGDQKTFPTRGQTCLVANSCNSTITRQNADGTWTFIIPRFYDGGTIIGGTKEPHDWNSEAVLETRQKLLKSAAQMYPDILNAEGGFDVITDVVGRRPTREGGMKIEIEYGKHGGSGDGPVVHAYGAGGRGFELSWGVAEEVGAMVMSLLGGVTLVERPKL